MFTSYLFYWMMMTITLMVDKNLQAFPPLHLLSLDPYFPVCSSMSLHAKGPLVLPGNRGWWWWRRWWLKKMMMKMMMQMTGSNQLLIGERVPHVIKPGLHWDDPHIIVRGDLLKHFTSRKGLYCIFSWNLFWSCVFSLVRFPNCLEANGLGNLTSFSDVFGMIILRFHNLLLFPKASQPPVQTSCIPRNAKVAQRTRLRAYKDPKVPCYLPGGNHHWMRPCVIRRFCIVNLWSGR